MSSPHPPVPPANGSSAPRVSFIVPLYNCLPLTQAMLASLQATVPRRLAHEIILVDDGSTDGTRDWLRCLDPAADPAIRIVLNERNLGFAGANNRGARLARGQFLALLNNDLVLQRRWLEPMLGAHRLFGRRAGLVGNVQIAVKSGEIDHSGIVINRQGKPVHARARPAGWRQFFAPLRNVPAVTGACVVLRRSLWEELGGFDEHYVNGGEDIDLCFRARRTGRVNLVALRSVVQHHVSSSPGRKLRDEENSYRLAQTWGPDFILAADQSAREWCRAYLASILAAPKSRDWVLGTRCCLFAAHLAPYGPPEAYATIAAEFEKELAHWQKLFPADNATAPVRCR